METRSTQSKASPTGSLSRISAARLRIVASIAAMLAAVNIGLTTSRCRSCLGGSIAMNIGSGKSLSWSRMVMPPRLQSDENSSWPGLDREDILVFP